MSDQKDSRPRESVRKKILLDTLRPLTTDANFDPEEDHFRADRALLAYIDDAEVTALFEQIEKWYA